jgi:hypothetical protein
MTFCTCFGIALTKISAMKIDFRPAEPRDFVLTRAGKRKKTDYRDCGGVYPFLFDIR